MTQELIGLIRQNASAYFWETCRYFIGWWLHLTMLLPSIYTLFIIPLLRHSWASPVSDDLSLTSFDILDPISETLSDASVDPNLYLDSLSSSSSGSDLNLFEPLEQTADPGWPEDLGVVTVADNYCPVVNGQSRKRDGTTCPAPGAVTLPTLGIFGDPNDEDIITQSEEDKKKNPNICSEIMFFFGRIFDVCCNGPFGPYVIDTDVRLIYNYISDCRLGKFKLDIPCSG